MKNKNQKMQVLKEDLIKYSKQIRILDVVIPELVFYGEDFLEGREETCKRHGIHSRRGGRYTTMFGSLRLLCRRKNQIMFIVRFGYLGKYPVK